VTYLSELIWDSWPQNTISAVSNVFRQKSVLPNYSFIYLNQATWPIRNKNMKKTWTRNRQTETDRDRLTKPCNTENTTSL